MEVYFGNIIEQVPVLERQLCHSPRVSIRSKHSYGKSPFKIGNPYINGWVSIAMVVYPMGWTTFFNEPSTSGTSGIRPCCHPHPVPAPSRHPWIHSQSADILLASAAPQVEGVTQDKPHAMGLGYAWKVGFQRNFIYMYLYPIKSHIYQSSKAMCFMMWACCCP